MQTRDSAHAVAPGTVLVAVSITSFLVPFLSSSINLALPAIGRDFEMGAVLLGWVATSFLLTTAVFLLPFGSLADLTGRVPLYRAGLLLLWSGRGTGQR